MTTISVRAAVAGVIVVAIQAVVDEVRPATRTVSVVAIDVEPVEVTRTAKAASATMIGSPVPQTRKGKEKRPRSWRTRWSTATRVTATESAASTWWPPSSAYPCSNGRNAQAAEAGRTDQ